MKYVIIDASIPEKLEDKVNAKIQEGWTPIGGVGVSTVDFDEHFYQAMVSGGEYNENR